MNMTITKTEAKVLREAAESSIGRACGVSSKGRTSRATAAIRKLVRRGLMDDIHSDTEWDIHRGRTTIYVVTTARITDAGRESIS